MQDFVSATVLKNSRSNSEVSLLALATHKEQQEQHQVHGSSRSIVEK